jgi:hypothetical protein
MSLFLLGKIFNKQILISAETACWEIERKCQIFNEDFYLPLYLPLWCGLTLNFAWRGLRVMPRLATLPLLPASPAPCSRRNWLLIALGREVE